MRWTLPLLALACTSTTKDPDPVDTDVDTVLVDTSVSVDDEDPWETGLVDGEPDFDTYVVNDPPVGTTAVDGVYGGTFQLDHLIPIGSRDPTCHDGAITVEIDGRAPRHVIVYLDCLDWRPQPGGLIGTYDRLSGIGFATLDPNDLSNIRADISIAAPGMGQGNLTEVRLRITDGALTINHDQTVGLFTLRTGWMLQASAELGVDAPVLEEETDDTDVVPMDTADTATHTGAN